MLAPIVEDLAKEYDGKVVFYRINIDKNEALANKFEITSIPALKVFKNGKIVADGGEAYSSKTNAKRAAKRLTASIATATIEIL